MLTKLLWVFIALPLLVYSAAIAALYFFQESLIFRGDKLPADHTFAFDLPFEEVTIPVDGAELNALHFQQADPKGVIFFLHGNAGNLVDWTIGVDYYQRINYDLFIFDYRGYGKSTGKISSQEQLMDDVRSAWDYMKTYYANSSQIDIPMIIYGRSLGTALAAQLAQEKTSSQSPEKKPELVVLVSPFTSMVDLAQTQYPIAPSSLLRYPFETEKIIDDINTEIVFMHGSEDNFIPISHSQALQTRVSKPTQLLTIEGAGHGDIHNFKTYLDGLASVLPE
ncbi:MAG: alpha/beta hydrolase [Cellvibrionaceae bacterium]